MKMSLEFSEIFQKRVQDVQLPTTYGDSVSPFFIAAQLIAITVKALFTNAATIQK